MGARRAISNPRSRAPGCRRVANDGWSSRPRAASPRLRRRRPGPPTSSVPPFRSHSTGLPDLELPLRFPARRSSVSMESPVETRSRVRGYRPRGSRRHGVEVIPTLRRSRDDIFLIGEEQILTDQETGRSPDPMFQIDETDGRSSRRPRRSPHLDSSLHGARVLVPVGLIAGVAALIAALELGGGEGPASAPPPSSPRSPLISRSTARVPTKPAARVHTRGAHPVEVHRPGVHDHHPHRPRHTRPPVSVPTEVTQSEPEREPTIPVAPVSSPAVTPAEPTPEPEEARVATAAPTSPGPPPSSSGGGPAGVESFGFER
jgi:hypothetical protein